MKNKKKYALLVLYFFLGLISFAPSIAYAACTNPPGGEGVILYSEDQNVPQYCDGTKWVSMAVLNPAAGGSGCAAPGAIEGVILYNSDLHVPQYCDGDDWVALGGGWGPYGDGSYAAFLTFTDLTDQSTSTQVTSNILQISRGGPISISGDGSPEYRICDDDTCSSETQTWGSASGTISGGEFLQLRLTSNAAISTMNSATVAIGSGSDKWDVTTGAGGPTGCPTVGDVCSDGTVYAGLSPDGNVAMYTTAADASSGTPWNNGNSTGRTTTSQTSTTTGQSNTANLITIDSDSGTVGMQQHQAAQLCADSTANGQTDWYLPAKDELNVLYTNKAAIGGFNTGGSLYWSSTEDNNSNAWIQRFSDGGQNDDDKNTNYLVRCVRR